LGQFYLLAQDSCLLNVLTDSVNLLWII
jgi:hypothetical protein